MGETIREEVRILQKWNEALISTCPKKCEEAGRSSSSKSKGKSRTHRQLISVKQMRQSSKSVDKEREALSAPKIDTGCNYCDPCIANVLEKQIDLTLEVKAWQERLKTKPPSMNWREMITEKSCMHGNLSIPGDSSLCVTS